MRKVRAAAQLIACAWLGAATACGAELPQEPEGAAPAHAAPAAVRQVRSVKLAIQRRADGLEQISLRARPQHVTVARASDGGVQHQCASEAP